ncbi:putative ABC transport system permease protein [Paenibacillus shirakamiensis]|uniref:Putative hemin transport system permease protein HrtB n=1 Tax=Paenibacillus shirakamiensis TaxID=1265935 RepID=A0ABS4JD75_9BACL|nr:ABC transporter permease [Paenibacillus shirakamiensis]MBP1999677.1 putative ABC transport system permease protein [Paenibacillus shirakamiensis]
MYLALREMRFAKTRYALIMTMLLLVSFLVLFVTGLARGLAYANASSVENMQADYFMLQKGSDSRFSRSDLSENALQEAQQIVGQDKAASLNLQMTNVTAEGSDQKLDVTMFSVDKGSFLAPEKISGQAFADLKSGSVLVDQKLEDSGVKLGSQLRDTMTGTTWTVGGFVNNESYSHTPVIFMSPDGWKEWRQQFITSKNAGTLNHVNVVAIQGDKALVDQVKSKVQSVDVITKKAAISAIPGYKEEQGSLLMMISFLFVISGFVLAVFFYIITIQKTSQFGMLKAIGTPTKYLAGSVIGQVMFLTLSSLLLGILAVKGVGMLLPASMPFQLSGTTMFYTGALFVAMALLGSIISVLKVAKTDALDAIGRVAA